MNASTNSLKDACLKIRILFVFSNLSLQDLLYLQDLLFARHFEIWIPNILAYLSMYFYFDFRDIYSAPNAKHDRRSNFLFFH